MKIRSIRHNNRKKVFEVGTSTKTLVFPFSKAAPTPTTEDPVTELSVDCRKSVDQLLALLQVLNCDVNLVGRTLHEGSTGSRRSQVRCTMVTRVTTS